MLATISSVTLQGINAKFKHMRASVAKWQYHCFRRPKRAGLPAHRELLLNFRER